MAKSCANVGNHPTLTVHEDWISDPFGMSRYETAAAY